MSYPSARIADVAAVNPRGWTVEPNDTDEVSFVPMASVEVMTGRLDPSAIRLWSAVKKGYTRFEEGDVLVAKITPSMENGKAALAVGLSGGRGVGSTEFHVLRPGPNLDPKYLLHYVIQSATRRSARAQMRGVAGQLRVPPEFFFQHEIPLPPLDEQKHIVEAIETQFARLDDAVASLKRARTRLKRYRASVLKAACEGQFVPTEAELARQEGRSYEPASVLLERIAADREATPGKKRGKAKTTASLNTAALPALPEGWAWTTLREIKAFSLYGPRFSSDDYSSRGYVVLRTSDISQSGKVNLENAPRLPLDAAEFEKYRAKIGDLLFTRTGSLGTLAVFNDDVEAIPGAYLIQFRLLAPSIASWFIFYFFRSNAGQNALVAGGAGVGRPNLNAPTIEAVPLAFPPLDEQERIVAEVERRLSIIERMETTVETNLKRAESLRQSILRLAFSGRLVQPV